MAWVDTMRKRFQASLDVWNGKPFGRGLDSEKNMRISRRIPTRTGGNDALYVFTIDLDQLIFWVCGQPVFDLANMPQGGEFVNYIGECRLSYY